MENDRVAKGCKRLYLKKSVQTLSKNKNHTTFENRHVPLSTSAPLHCVFTPAFVLYRLCILDVVRVGVYPASEESFFTISTGVSPFNLLHVFYTSSVYAMRCQRDCIGFFALSFLSMYLFL